MNEQYDEGPRRLRRSDNVDIYPDFHGPHAEEQRPDAETITWQEPMSRFQSVRVIRHTCECQEVIYELCVGGGLAWCG